MASLIGSNEGLKDRYSDIFLSHTVLIIIGAVIGVFGNGATVLFYSCRIKERGERYFIPLLVDLIACLDISTNYVMNNTYFYDYPSNTICCVTTFMQVFASGLSAHILLIISVQRYLLVCKPFGPKMTLFWKKVSLAVACLFTFSYSCPLLGLSGTIITEEVFNNHTINTTTCRLTTVDTMPVTIYVGLISLILVCNLVMTTILCIPVLKRIKLSIRKKSESNLVATKKEDNISSHEITETSLTKTSGLELGSDISSSNMQSSGNNTTLNVDSDQEPSNDAHRNRDFPSLAVEHSSTNDNSSTANRNKENIKSSSKSKRSSAKKRISSMFVVIITAYVISYIPTVVCVILTYTIGNFNDTILSKGETIAWLYIARLIFVNHLVNPFIYCYFDVKLKRELKKCCKRE
ncbi:uncharacterized protein LOC134697204 [Mytilus trossulus]|uniref:uncharacterized protein LOC134697204 n=1 Tax=Mytilus trossulus TaxID=6551 RepID=UPI003006D1E7